MMKSEYSENERFAEALIQAASWSMPQDPEVAKRCYLLASKLGDGSGGARALATYRLGKMSLDRKEYSEALRWFRKSFRQDPEHNVTMFMLAKTFHLLGRLPESKAMLRRLLRAYPDHEGGNVLLKRVLKAGPVSAKRG